MITTMAEKVIKEVVLTLFCIQFYLSLISVLFFFLNHQQDCKDTRTLLQMNVTLSKTQKNGRSPVQTLTFTFTPVASHYSDASQRPSMPTGNMSCDRIESLPFPLHSDNSSNLHWTGLYLHQHRAENIDSSYSGRDLQFFSRLGKVSEININIDNISLFIYCILLKT